MAPSIVAALAIGGLLGFRHAFEPDHLAAVSTLATRPTARLWSAARLGLVWGLGHTVTVGIFALLIIVLGVQLPARFWPAAELLVAGLLVLLGVVVIWRYFRGRWHMHVHVHPAASAHLHLHSHTSDDSHAHAHGVDARRSLGFGVAHGLAGSGAIAALLVAAAPDTTTRIAYFAAFGARAAGRWARRALGDDAARRRGRGERRCRDSAGVAGGGNEVLGSLILVDSPSPFNPSSSSYR